MIVQHVIHRTNMCARSFSEGSTGIHYYIIVDDCISYSVMLMSKDSRARETELSLFIKRIKMTI